MRKRLFALTLVLLLLCGCSPVDKVISSQVAVQAPPEDYQSEQTDFRYTRSFLTNQEQAICDRILEGISIQAPVIEDLYPDETMLTHAVQAIERDYPELFWFSGSGRIETTYMGDIPVSAAYTPKYLMNEAQRQETQALIDGWVTACFATIPAGASDYDKIMAVYNAILDNADYGAVEGNSIVNILVYGKGLCGCYAKTVQYLLNQLGVDCAYISGSGNGETHAWNLVWPDGNPCWLDATWGDPISENGQSLPLGRCYDYFCITTSDLLRNHSIDDTIPVPDCTCEDYNYYRVNGLFFETYDRAAITDALSRTQGEGGIALRFSDAAYPTAVSALIDEGEIQTLLRNAGRNPGSSFLYSRNDVMGTIAFSF